jgi:CelD/BcsL family acetyltransferase involved in cellulose biosynthesis
VLDARFIFELGALEHLYAEWDALAVSNALPAMAPGWLLAWWRHLAPEGALLRAIEIRDGAELVGLAPFFAVRAKRGGRVEYRLLGNKLVAPLALLSVPGREHEVATATGQALSQADPRPDLIVLQATRVGSPWHLSMRAGWLGRTRPISFVYGRQPYPTVWLQGTSVEAWLASRSSKFRSSMRRLNRRFDELGGTWRMSTADTLRRDIESFQRLHAARWLGRGHSTFVTPGQRVVEMLQDAGDRLIGEERFRVWVMEIDGEPIATDIYLCAGGNVTGVNCGWDERWKGLSPPLLSTMHTIEDSIERGETRLDMGAGEESHKTRFANCDSPLAWSVLMTPGRRLAHTVAQTAPGLATPAARDLARRRLKPEQVDRLRDMQRRVRALRRGVRGPRDPSA